MTRRKFVAPPEPPGMFSCAALIVPQLFCADCHWHVCQPNMPTFWAGGRALVCVFCAHLRVRPRVLRPLHPDYEDWVAGCGPVLTVEERSRLLWRLGARFRASYDQQAAA